MKYILHIVFTAISIALAGLIFLISHEQNVWLEWGRTRQLIVFLTSFDVFKLSTELTTKLLTYFVYLTYLVVLLWVSNLSIKFSYKYLDQYLLENKKIVAFDQANDFYLPIYLGYAFVAISLPTLKSFILFFLLMLIVLSRTRFFYFNPIFLILGYKFYFITNDDSSKILIISKKESKTVQDFFENRNGDIENQIALTKINDYTFLILD